MRLALARRGGLPAAPLAALWLLTGCLSVAPPAAEPPVGVGDAWTAGPELAPAPDEPTPWWQELDDRALADLIEEALAANPTLLAAAARVEAAVARARIAGAELSPQVGLSLEASRRRQAFVGLPIPGFEDRVLSIVSTSFGTSLNVSWEADLWGRVRAGRHAAVAEVEASRAEQAAARLSLSGQVAKAWFAALEAASQVELAAAVVASWHDSRTLVDERYRRGLVPSLDLRFADAGLAQAESVLELRRRQLDAARRQLELLVGRYPAAEIELAAALPAESAAIPPGLPAEVLVRRPDLAAAERRLEAAGYRVHQARAALYPQLRLTSSAGTLSTDVGDLLDGDFRVWSVAAGLLQPLFQGGRLQAGVDLAAAGYEQALALYAREVLQALAEVESALAAEELLARREEALERAAREAQGAAEVAEERYRAGLAPFLTVLESRRLADTTRSQLLEARRQRLTNRIDLVLALGGGVTTSGQTEGATAVAPLSLREREGARGR